MSERNPPLLKLAQLPAGLDSSLAPGGQQIRVEVVPDHSQVAAVGEWHEREPGVCQFRHEPRGPRSQVEERDCTDTSPGRPLDELPNKPAQQDRVGTLLADGERSV